jgi:S1-C subfamily serine protease
MTILTDAVSLVANGVVHVILERNHARVGSGSGFLIGPWIATASHVIRAGDFDTVTLAFDDGKTAIRMAREDIFSALAFESDWTELDVALMAIDQPELANRHRFEPATEPVLAGHQVLLLGYPFESTHLAAHVAYVSSVHKSGSSDVLQLDGSANPSNSGGPVIDPESLRLVGWVVRAQTGLEKDFDALIKQLHENVQVLSQQRGARMTIGGLDPVEVLRATMASLSKLASNMKRTANVGIAYATSAGHLRELADDGSKNDATL